MQKGVPKTKAEACNFIAKETLAQAFSCEIYEIFIKHLFYRAPPVAASMWYEARVYGLLNFSAAIIFMTGGAINCGTML